MEIKASYLAIAGGIEATRADALLGILKERGRGFASDSETWAELRLMLETIRSQVKAIENVHTEMWASVKDRNDDAFSALLQEFERSAARLSGDWARISVMAKIALEDPELPPEPTREEQIEADRERLFRIRAKRDNIMAVLPYAQGELATDLVDETNRINAEEGEIIARLPAEEPEEQPRSTYYVYAGDMTPEQYEDFRKEVDADRERLQAIRTRRKEIAAAAKSEKVFGDLAGEDEELSREEAEIETALEAAGVHEMPGL